MTEQIERPSYRVRRKTTNHVARLLLDRTNSHVKLLASMIRPSTVLGSFIAESGVSSQNEKAVAEFKNQYHAVASEEPFNDKTELAGSVKASWNGTEIQHFTYRVAVGNGAGRRSIAAVSPLEFAVSYAGWGLDAFRTLRGQPDSSQALTRPFLLHSVLMNFVMTRPACAGLLAALRYQVTTKNLPEFGRLPIACLSLGLPTARPSDEEIMELIDDEGVDKVFEVLMPDAIDNFCDPLKSELVAAVGAAAGRRVGG